MKLLFILLFTMPGVAYAAEPVTSCPGGYTTINEKYMVVANSSCPSEYVSVGIASTCLATNPAGSCIMYAPTNTTYSDDVGIYEFTSVCPMS